MKQRHRKHRLPVRVDRRSLALRMSRKMLREFGSILSGMHLLTSKIAAAPETGRVVRVGLPTQYWRTLKLSAPSPT